MQSTLLVFMSLAYLDLPETSHEIRRVTSVCDLYDIPVKVM